MKKLKVGTTNRDKNNRFYENNITEQSIKKKKVKPLQGRMLFHVLREVHFFFCIVQYSRCRDFDPYTYSLHEKLFGGHKLFLFGLLAAWPLLRKCSRKKGLVKD